jgi:hypothetical protein
MDEPSDDDVRPALGAVVLTPQEWPGDPLHSERLARGDHRKALLGQED